MLLIAAPLISFLAVTSAQAESQVHPPSRFGKLTSSRWAYGATFERATLQPVPNPNPNAEPQPRRQRPSDVAITRDGRKVYISLKGTELRPGNQVVVYDVARRKVIRRILLKLASEQGLPGSRPFRLALHPSGRFLFVTNQFSNFISVIDTSLDRVIAEIPADFYCEGITFDSEGKRAFVANRYLDQVFVIDIDAGRGGFLAEMRELGGLDDKRFQHQVHHRLAKRCGTCHRNPGHGFYAGPDKTRSFLSAIPYVHVGDAAESPLLRAVIRTRDGGYADQMPRSQSHAKGTVVFTHPAKDPDYQAIANWINASAEGPGIPVGNPFSKPSISVLTSDGRFLLVGNTGTQNISVVNALSLEEVGDIYIQNVPHDLKIYQHPRSGHDYLLVTTLGAGFGVGKERDPYGGESWDEENPAAQFTAWRNLTTGRLLPRSQQKVLGPFQAVDGTASTKFQDIQNDLIIIDLTALDLPEVPPRGGAQHLLLANRYEAHRAWVRYSSDSAESAWSDSKGDIPPDLMRVVGAFPDRMALVEDRLYVAMLGSNQVQEWKIDPYARHASDILVPKRVFQTGLQPTSLAAGGPGTAAEEKLFAADFLGGTLSLIDTRSGRAMEILVDPSVLRRPVPDTDAERGEIFAHTALFSSDGDTSCYHCHYRNMGDGRPWGVNQVAGQEFVPDDENRGHTVIGGAMGMPQIRGIFEAQPILYEGILSGYEARPMIMEHDQANDYRKPLPGGFDFGWVTGHRAAERIVDFPEELERTKPTDSTLDERRDAQLARLSLLYFGKSFSLYDFQRFVGEWQMSEPRLLPNPYDHASDSVRRGRRLFTDPRVGCANCHTQPAFTIKNLNFNREQTFPPVVLFTVRDGAFTFISSFRQDWILEQERRGAEQASLNGRRAGDEQSPYRQRGVDLWDAGRAEQKEGQITTSHLRGIWDRPPVFLHNGLARTLREVVATGGHHALRKLKYVPLLGGVPERPGRLEVGFNETVWYKERSQMASTFFAAGARIGMDTHGGTSHLTGRDVDDIVNFMKAIE